MTMNRSLSEAARGPHATFQVRLPASAAKVQLFTESPNAAAVSSPQSPVVSTEYVYVGPMPRRAEVTAELSTLERVLEYLKALYR